MNLFLFAVTLLLDLDIQLPLAHPRIPEHLMQTYITFAPLQFLLAPVGYQMLPLECGRTRVALQDVSLAVSSGVVWGQVWGQEGEQAGHQEEVSRLMDEVG